MEKMFAMSRRRDNKRVEFFCELRNGRMVYIIREEGMESQDSVTHDRAAVDAFRDGLLRDGYMEMPL